MSVRRYLSARLSVGFALSFVSAHVLAAQITSSQPNDATVLPRRQFAVRLSGAFARFDALIGDGGPRNIAASFNTDSLGGAQVNQLNATQSLVRTLSGSSSFSVNAGRITAAADSRVVTVPLVLEYGLTNRLTLGIVIPLVETRTVLGTQFNPRGSRANVGPNPEGANWTANAQLVTSLRSAATALQTRLAQCQAVPASAGCAALLAQQTQAQALITATAPFASALESLYGTSATNPGTFFVPLNNGATQTAINAAIATFRNDYRGFGGTVSNASVAGATGPGAFNALDTLLVRAGYDTLMSPDHSSIGDIVLGATYQLANTFSDGSVGRGHRVSVNGAFRFGTGQPANGNRLFDNPTGYGQAGIIVGGAADVAFTPRFFASGSGSFTKQLGSTQIRRLPNADNAVLPLTFQRISDYTAGDVASLTLLPRYRMAGRFFIHGSYTLTHVGADSYPSLPFPELSGALAREPIAPYGSAGYTTHALGFGLTYSSFAEHAPGRLPYEASFRHEEVLSASGGPAPKVFVDQLQLRVFFR